MSELIAVNGCTLSHVTGSPISVGTFEITSTPDGKVKSDGNGVYKDPLAFTFSGGNANGFQDGSVTGGGSIPATSTKVKVGGLFVMREGDSVTMNCVGTIDPPPAPPASPTGPVSGDVEISIAGQIVVKSE